ncbi:carbohydrate kinase family protein [Actinoallomurus acaciae]|uniref:carbohydrate kinase family protein n=1 Tax=Actinoallomurus acaciae TaxID=502577 RepID=UPI00406BCBF1
MSPTDVLVVGGAGVDTIVRVPALPLPVRDSITVPPVEDFAAHTGNGVALGCHALGLRTVFVDVIGEDEQGRLVRRTYEEASLPFRYATHPSGTRRSVNLVDPQGNRLSLYGPRHPSGMKVDPGLYRTAVREARHVHVSIMPWAADALAAAVAAGTPTSTDLHDWDGENEHHRGFAIRADVVFVSAAELSERVDAVAGEIIERGRARAVVVMAGAAGCHLTVRGEPVRAIHAATLAGRSSTATAPVTASSPRSCTPGCAATPGRTRHGPARSAAPTPAAPPARTPLSSTPRRSTANRPASRAAGRPRRIGRLRRPGPTR